MLPEASFPVSTVLKWFLSAGIHFSSFASAVPDGSRDGALVSVMLRRFQDCSQQSSAPDCSSARQLPVGCHFLKHIVCFSSFYVPPCEMRAEGEEVRGSVFL